MRTNCRLVFRGNSWPVRLMKYLQGYFHRSCMQYSHGSRELHTDMVSGF